MKRASRRREGEEHSDEGQNFSLGRVLVVCSRLQPSSWPFLCTLTFSAMVPPCSTLHPMITACWVTTQFAAQWSATLGYHTRATASLAGNPSGSALDLRLPAAPEYHIPGGREAAPTQLSTAIRGLPTRAFVLYGIPRQDRNRSSLPARKPSFDTRTVPRGARGRLAAHSFFLPEDAPWTRRRRLLPSLRNSSPHRPLSVSGRESLPGLRPSVVQEPYEPASIDLL